MSLRRGDGKQTGQILDPVRGPIQGRPPVPVRRWSAGNQAPGASRLGVIAKDTSALMG
jgi:hypothetical protein